MPRRTGLVRSPVAYYRLAFVFTQHILHCPRRLGAAQTFRCFSLGRTVLHHAAPGRYPPHPRDLRALSAASSLELLHKGSVVTQLFTAVKTMGCWCYKAGSKERLAARGASGYRDRAPVKLRHYPMVHKLVPKRIDQDAWLGRRALRDVSSPYNPSRLPSPRGRRREA